MGAIIEFLKVGGVFMYPLLFLSIVTIAIVLERIISEFPWRKRVELYLDYMKTGKTNQGFIKNTEYLHLPDKFFKYSDKEKEPLITEKLQALFDRRLRLNEVISSIGSIAPLLGFIGTISGMINSFGAIANADKVSIKLVATGISEALVTTGYGLVIAVLSILIEVLLRYWFLRFTHFIEEKVNTMFDFHD